MRRIALAAALALALAGCREDFFDPTPGETGPKRSRLELIAFNVHILPGEAGAVRIGFAPREPSVHVRVERSSDAGRLLACPLRSVDDPLPPAAACLADLPGGVREGLTMSGLGAVALVREGDPMTLRIRLDYEEAGRSVSLRIPLIDRPPGEAVCRDNACNPFVELNPVRGGAFRATARFEGAAARLELLEGRVLARAFSSTGIPYRIAARSAGVSPLSVSATLNAPSEYALALVNTGDGDITAIRIDGTWP